MPEHNPQEFIPPVGPPVAAQHQPQLQRTAESGNITTYPVVPIKSIGGIDESLSLTRIRSSGQEATLGQMATEGNAVSSPAHKEVPPLDSHQEHWDELTPKQQALEKKYQWQYAVLDHFGVVGGFSEVRQGGNVNQALLLLRMTLSELDQAVVEEKEAYSDH